MQLVWIITSVLHSQAVSKTEQKSTFYVNYGRRTIALTRGRTSYVKAGERNH